MTWLGIAVAFLLLLWSALLYLPFRWRPVGIYLFMPKVFAVAYVPFIAAAGIVLAVVAAVASSWWMLVPAAVAAAGGVAVMVRVGAVRPDLSGAFGSDWDRRIPPEQRARMGPGVAGTAAQQSRTPRAPRCHLRDRPRH